MNPVPIPANLTMSQFMQLMQAQAPSLPGQGQQQAQQAPAAAGVGTMQPAYQQIHLPAGFSGPVFGFPNWVPAQQGIAGAQQQQQQPQWPMIPQVLGQPQVAPQQISMNDFTAALSAAVQSIQQDQDSSGPPVGSNPGDEQTLVDALRKGRESGLDPRQILDKLHKVNGHTQLEWKNYFLEHLDRLYRKTSTRRVEGLPPPLPHQRPPSSSDQDHAQKALPRLSGSASARGKLLARRQASRDTSRLPSPEPARTSKTGTIRKPGASIAGGAHSKKAKHIAEHAGVQVPWLPLYEKPQRPKVPPMTTQGRLGQFTTEEKIFFIQFLRWRLERAKGGPIPSQLKLCRAVNREAPHRSPESWQKHWDAYPDAPERLLKEATLSWTVVRAPMGRKSGVSVVPASAEDSEEDDAEGDGEMDEEDTSDDVSADESRKDDAVPSRPRKRKRRNGPARQKITEEDIREMAQYKLKRLHEWDELRTEMTRWEDFATQNTKRSHRAWVQVAHDRKDEINEILEELQEEEEDVEEQDSPVPAVPPLTDAASTSSVNAEKSPSVLQKRDTDSRLAVRSGSPVTKRIKQEPGPECISLLSDAE